MSYSLDAAPSARVEIQWQPGGAFDAVADDTLMGPGIEISLGRDQARAMGQPMTAQARFTLSNEDARYATEYQGSDLYGLIRPGRSVVVSEVVGPDWLMDSTDVLMDDPVALMGGADQIRLFAGVTDQTTETYGLGSRVVPVDCLGVLRRLLGATVTIGLQQDVTTGAAMQLLLDACGLSSELYRLDADAVSNGRVLSWWWVDNRNAYEVAQELWATEGPPAALYEDQDGVIVFESRNYRTLTARSTDVQASIGPALALWPTDVRYTAGYDRIVNDVRISTEERVQQATQVVWEASGPIVIGANDSWQFDVRTTDPLATVTAPVAGVDYSVTSGSLTLVDLDVTGAFTVNINLVAGASGATVGPVGGNDGLTLRAAPVTVVNRVDVTHTIDTDDSQELYGIRSLDRVSIWPHLQAADAQALADSYALFWQQARPQIEIVAVNASGALLYQMLARRVGDRLHVADVWSGLDMDVHIEQISYRTLSGTMREIVWACEKAIDQGYGQFDVGLFDVATFGQ